jgi:hypothetical protein
MFMCLWNCPLCSLSDRPTTSGIDAQSHLTLTPSAALLYFWARLMVLFGTAVVFCIYERFGKIGTPLCAVFPDARSSPLTWLWALALVYSCASQDTRLFSISISSGGGFSGLVRGYRLQSDGKIVAFERRSATGESNLWSRSIDAGTMRSFAQKLLATGLLGQTSREYGNITSRIVYESSDSTFVWTWSGSEPTPVLVAAWYRDTMRFCSGLGPDSTPPRNRN